MQLILFLAVFGLGLFLLMSGIAVRPWGFGEAFDPARVAVGGVLMAGALGIAILAAYRHSVPRDDAKAVKRYLTSAEQGHAAAQFNLGIMYDTGRGVDQDFAVAVGWYRKAADQGFAKAQFNLAQMYRRGEGVERDLAEAAK